MAIRPISVADEPELHYLVNWMADSMHAQMPRLLLADDPQPFVQASLEHLILSEGSLQEWSAEQLALEIRAQLQIFAPSRDWVQ